jgi:hypothetical protein
MRVLGHWVEYDEPAARDAEKEMRGLLAANLGDLSADESAEKRYRPA